MRPFLALALVAFAVPAAWSAAPEDERARTALVLALAARRQPDEPSKCSCSAGTAASPGSGTVCHAGVCRMSETKPESSPPCGGTLPDRAARKALVQALASLTRSRSPTNSDCACGCQEGGPCDCPHCPAGGGLTYEQAVRLAMDTSNPLVVFVGQPSHAVSGCVRCEVSDFPGTSGSCVVIGRPWGQKMLRVADISGQPARETIQAVLARTTPASPLTGVAPTTGAIPPFTAPPFFGSIGFGGGCPSGMVCGGGR